MTAREIVQTALELTGHCPPGEEPESEHAAWGLKHLNWQLKSWQTVGVCDGWRYEDLEITWPAATASGSLNTNYLDLDNLRIQDSDGIDTTLIRYSLQEYADIPDKTQAGTPTGYNIRKTRSTLALSLWPVPAAESTLIADASRVMQDVTDLSQDVDIPQEWTECAFYSLAARLAIPLKLHLSDPARYAEIKGRAGELFATLKSFDEETGSVFLGVGE